MLVVRRVVVRFCIYCKEIWRNRVRASGYRGLLSWLSGFSDWQQSLDSSPVLDHRPWLTYGAIKFLSGVLRCDMRVLEYGIGGSTLFFLERGCNVISIEHDPEWAQNLHSQVFPLSSRWQLLLIPPVKVNRKMNKETD